MPIQETIEFEPIFQQELKEQIDCETHLWSGGFQKHTNYTFLRHQGEEILPSLFEDISNDDCAGFWWRISMIHDILEDQGHKIYLHPEYAGRLKKVTNSLIEYGQLNGYLN